jgi:murein DD-endopeptidase MepM/ murein hydrolase activator NlpD
MPRVLRAWLVFWLVCWLVGCQPGAGYVGTDPAVVSAPPPRRPAAPPHLAGALEDRMVDFKFDGGELDFELYRNGTQIEQVVRNRYAVPVMLRWTMRAFDNVQPLTQTEGTVLLPAATGPLAIGAPIVLAGLQQLDPSARYRRELYFHARFGDPEVRPEPYVYALPYPRGRTFSVLQGFHGAFSHRGSNEYAVDFNCPVATPVVAARPGIVVATHAGAQGSGTTAEFLDDRRGNFVIIQHDDGTLGEYMHLSPSGVGVKPGQAVARGEELALSGNTGFSSTPHLHFQVMTSSEDGLAKQPFPFVFAIGARRVSAPMQGQRYEAWE